MSIEMAHLRCTPAYVQCLSIYLNLLFYTFGQLSDIALRWSAGLA